MSSFSILPPLSATIGTCSYIVTFVLGLIGHACSLLTFSQRELRSTSTTLLFLGSTISDSLYLFMSLNDFILVDLGLPQLSPYYISICRFRTFILNFAQTTSAWLLVCVACDRLIRARLPHRTRQWCIKKNAVIAHVIITLCSVAFNSHVLQPSFTTIYSFSRVLCGPSHDNATHYEIFYYGAWPALQIRMNILVPTLWMIVCLLGSYQKVHDAALVRHTQHLQKQMLLLMLSKTMLFLVCTLTYGVFRMNIFYSIDSISTSQSDLFQIIGALFPILLSANYSLAFYIHCSTSTLFRNTFFKTIKNFTRPEQRQHIVRPGVCLTASNT